VNCPAPRGRYAKELEQVVAHPPLIELSGLVGVQLDVHDAEQVPLIIDHGKGEEAVLDEELARLQHGRPRRQRDHTGTMISATGCSGKPSNSRRVGTTPSKRPSSSTTYK
jgi:hypothetical protein